MKVVVHGEADAELTAAAEWYEREREGLGDDLLAEEGGRADVLSCPMCRPRPHFGQPSGRQR